MNPHPIGTFARLAFARARRLSAALGTQVPSPAEAPSPVVTVHSLGLPGWLAGCSGSCTQVPGHVWDALDSVYPDVPLEGPGKRKALAVLFAPLMALQGWRFCGCYLRTASPEYRFIAHLVDTRAANAAAGGLPRGVRHEA